MLRLTSGKNLGLLLLSTLIAVPVSAHTVEVSGDVAATFHIHPGHNPKAGQPSQAWFALTRRGGASIPLSQCNCVLSVYPKPRPQNAQPLINPPLKPISAEDYQGIPGAEIVFPKAGAYDLELRGTPKAGANFKPFSLTYTVTVSAGSSAPTASPLIEQPRGNQPPDQRADSHKVAQQPKATASQWRSPVIILAAVLGIGIFGIAVQRFKQPHSNAASEKKPD